TLAAKMIELFHDGEHGGFFYTATNHEELITRNKESHDGSTPSGNSMAAYALLRLGHLCGRSDFEQIAVRTLEFLSPILARSPIAGGKALLALDFLLGPTREIAIVDGTRPDDTTELLRALHRRFVPNKVLARKPHGTDDKALSPALQSLLKGKTSRGGEVTTYICNHGTCGLPATGIAAVETL